MLTSESVRLDLPIAGPASRMAAYAIDFLIIAVLIVAVAVLLAGSGTFVASWVRELVGEFPSFAVEPGAAPDVDRMRRFMLLFTVVFVTLQLGVEVVYFVLFDALWRGQSLGKRVLRLRVVSDDGSGVTMGQSLARNLLRLADILPAQYVVGLASMLSSPSGKRLGDWAAGTVVVRLDRPRQADEIDDEARPDDDSFVFEVAGLRRIGPMELKLIRRALRRIDEASAEVRLRVLADASAALATRVGVATPKPEQQAAFLRALHRAVALHR